MAASTDHCACRSRNVAVLLYLAALAVGLAAFVLTPTPHPLAPPHPQTTLGTGTPYQRNLAEVSYGAQIRASSYDHFRSHHPLFAIDGEGAPTETEKWASAAEDLRPWIEVLWTKPRDFGLVWLYHAGWREPTTYTNGTYLLRCFRGSREVCHLQVTGNHEPIAQHALACNSVDRLRIDFALASSHERARLYEIAAWGQP